MEMWSKLLVLPKMILFDIYYHYIIQASHFPDFPNFRVVGLAERLLRQLPPESNHHQY